MKKLVPTLLLCVSACAHTSSSRTTDTPAVAQNEDDASGEVVCREEVPTGSLLPQKVCFRKDALDARRQGGQDFVNSQQRGGLQGVSRN